MNHKLCCIGYITRDKIVTPDNTVYMPGGTAFYFAKAVSRLQADDFSQKRSVVSKPMISC